MRLTLLVIAAASLWGVGGLCGYRANALILMMVEEINRTRDKDDLISQYWWTPAKYWTIFREYDRLYPSGKLSLQTVIWWFGVFVSGGGFIVCLMTLLRSQ